MPAHTGAQGGCDFLRDIHTVPSLVIQAQHRGLFLLRDKGLHLHIAGGKQSAGNAAQINGFLSLIDVKSKNFLCFFLCFYISMPAPFAAIQGGPCAAFLKDAAALHIPGRQASPAWSISASLSWGGSSLPLASALRSIPRQAVLLK